MVDDAVSRSRDKMGELNGLVALVNDLRVSKTDSCFLSYDSRSGTFDKKIERQ